jgi:hypothetical protein
MISVLSYLAKMLPMLFSAVRNDAAVLLCSVFCNVMFALFPLYKTCTISLLQSLAQKAVASTVCIDLLPSLITARSSEACLLPALIFRVNQRRNVYKVILIEANSVLRNKAYIWTWRVRFRDPSFAFTPPRPHQPCGKLHLVNGHITLDGLQLWTLALSFTFNMCIYQKTTTSRPFPATKGSEVRASSPSPKCSFVVIPNRMTPIPKISLTMRVSRTTALPFALTENLDNFNEPTSLSYEPTQLFYEDEVLTNDEYCFMNPKYVVCQRSALDSPPPLRRSSRYISIIPPTVLPERLIFPDF